MMSNFTRLSLAFLLLTAAGGNHLSALDLPPVVTISTTLIAYIGQELNFSFDSTEGSSATLLGYFNPESAAPSSPATLPYSFTLRPGASVQIGSAHFISNLTGGATVKVISKNGGKLLDSSGKAPQGFDYDLIVDGTRIPAVGGFFTFTRSGKSSKNSRAIAIGIYISSTGLSFPAGIYSDELTFSASAP